MTFKKINNKLYEYVSANGKLVQLAKTSDGWVWETASGRKCKISYERLINARADACFAAEIEESYQGSSI